MWLLMITLHTVAATVCFGAGVYVLSPSRAQQQRWLVPVFLWSLIGMAIFLVAAMASHWSELSNLTRAIYSGLAVLALYMIYRAYRASRSSSNDGSVADSYMDDVGFVLISLFNGFVIVLAIDLGAPGWAVGPGAVLAAVIGIQLVHRAKSRESIMHG